MNTPRENHANVVSHADLQRTILNFQRNDRLPRNIEAILMRLHQQEINQWNVPDDGAQKERNVQLIEMMRQNPVLRAYLDTCTAEQELQARTRLLLGRISNLQKHADIIAQAAEELTKVRDEQATMQEALRSEFARDPSLRQRLDQLAQYEHKVDPDFSYIAADALEPNSSTDNDNQLRIAQKPLIGIDNKIALFSEVMNHPSLTNVREQMANRIKELQAAKTYMTQPHMPEWVAYYFRAYYELPKQAESLENHIRGFAKRVAPFEDNLRGFHTVDPAGYRPIPAEKR